MKWRAMPSPKMEEIHCGEVLAGERLALGLDDTHDAVEERFFGQAVDVVLERVGHEATVHPHPRLAHVLVVIAAQHLLDELVEVAVVAEHDVAAVVPDEAVRVAVARCEAADVVGRLEDVPAVVVELGEPVGGTEAGGPCAEDGDLVAHADTRSLSGWFTYSRVARWTLNLRPSRTPCTIPRV